MIDEIRYIDGYHEGAVDTLDVAVATIEANKRPLTVEDVKAWKHRLLEIYAGKN